jgi:UMP-CMP kinase
MAASSPQSATASSRPTLIYILGAPGADKGSLCAPLSEQLANVWHLSTGDYLRSILVQDPSQDISQSFGGLDRDMSSRLMQQRQLLPSETIVSIVDTALRAISGVASDHGVHSPIILVDGFPRSLEADVMADACWGAAHRVLFFDCPRQLTEARFLNRRRSTDDSVEIFRTRCDEFERLNGDILAMYSGIVVRVNTETDNGETWDGLPDRVSVLMESLGATKRDTSHEM